MSPICRGASSALHCACSPAGASSEVIGFFHSILKTRKSSSKQVRTGEVYIKTWVCSSPKSLALVTLNRRTFQGEPAVLSVWGLDSVRRRSQHSQRITAQGVGLASSATFLCLRAACPLGAGGFQMCAACPSSSAAHGASPSAPACALLLQGCLQSLGCGARKLGSVLHSFSL